MAEQSITKKEKTKGNVFAFEGLLFGRMDGMNAGYSLSYSQVAPTILWYPFILSLLHGERHCASNVSCARTLKSACMKK